MKIIHKPIFEALPDGWWVGLSGRCMRCETVVKIEAADAVARIYESGSYVSAWFNCQNCSGDISVSTRREEREMIQAEATVVRDERTNFFKRLLP